MRKKTTLRKLQSVIGTLNFACQVIQPGRAFLQGLIALTRGKLKPYWHIRLSKEAKLDLKVWIVFLEKSNYKFFQLRWLDSKQIHM